MNKVKVGNRFIGDSEPCFVILELGVNFKDMQEAKRLVDTAIDIGADAVKFQTFHAKTVVIPGAMLSDGRGQVDQYQEILGSEDRLTDEFQTQIIRYAQDKGIITFSTPSHRTDIDLLARIGNIPALKIGSDDLTNIPLLRYAAKFGKPIFLSTGVSGMEDIKEAVEAIKKEGNDEIVLLHCVSRYPARPEDMNLLNIRTLKDAFGLPVGLSDHTEGIAVSIAAAALGACVIEKHFTLDRSAEGPDNFFSMEPCGMKMIIEGVKEAQAALGSPVKDIRKSEEPMKVNFHKSIFAVKDIEAGEAITEDKVDILRPLIGIPAKYYESVLGKSANRRVKKGSALQWEDFKAV